MDRVNLAKFLATTAHQGQTRSDDSPYIHHPFRVAELVKARKMSKNIEDLIIAAILHDTIEDTEMSEELIAELFGDMVLSIVLELTSDKEKIKEVGKAEYLIDKMINMSSYALLIKLCDRLDNVSDLKTAKSDKWRIKYANETMTILNRIEVIDMSEAQKSLVTDIRKKLEELKKD